MQRRLVRNAGGDITVDDMRRGLDRAVEIASKVSQPVTLCGALAMSAYGYRRETKDIDIVLPAQRLNDAKEVAVSMGLTVAATHSFGGVDLRDGNVRVDILTLGRDMPSLVPAAIRQAVVEDLRVTVLDRTVFVVPLGYLVAMKLMAERTKDVGDIVELIKARIREGQWADERTSVLDVVREHLGWYAANQVRKLEKTAREEET